VHSPSHAYVSRGCSEEDTQHTKDGRAWEREREREREREKEWQCGEAEEGVPRVWAWTFMANHIDRNYCGNCRFSFVFDEESGGVV